MSDGRRFDSFCEHIEAQRFSGYDEYTRAHDISFADKLAGDPEMRVVFANLLDPDQLLARQKPGQIAMRVNKSIQAIERAEDPLFPVGRDTPEAWEPTHQRLVDDPDYLSKFVLNLVLPIAANVSERGKLLIATAQLSGRDGGLSVLEIGSSLGLNLKRFAMLGQAGLDYEEIQVMTDEDRNGDNRNDVDEARTLALNELIASRSFRLDRGVGMDIFHPENDEPYAQWAMSNSFYMGELLDRARTEQFSLLTEARPEQVSFEVLDASTDQPPEYDPFDIVYIPTMLYQLPKDERKAVVRNAHRWVTDDGLIVIQDFANLNRDGTGKFYKRNKWRWNYNLWARDLREGDRGFKKLMTAESGRVKRLTLEPALGELVVARETGLAPF
ncbi:MAG: class I SAM-dependent methyltransferase [Candidatus Saccharimonadales bacterium]